MANCIHYENELCVTCKDSYIYHEGSQSCVSIPFGCAEINAVHPSLCDTCLGGYEKLNAVCEHENNSAFCEVFD